jgi:MacB-like periplasmic core domain
MMTYLGTSWQNLRFSARMLRKSPGFATVVVLTLALGIGSNITIFSVVNGVLLKPLPYPHPEELVAVSHTAPGINLTNVGVSPSMYFIYREESRTFDDVGIYGDDSVNVTGLEAPDHVRALDVTDGVLPILGITPLLGHWFTPADDLPGRPDTVMLTYGYWRRNFDGDHSVIGRMIDVDGKPREIIGVLPQTFRFLDEPDPALILPIKLDRATTLLGDFSLQGIARLKPGVTIAQANVDVARMLPIVARSFPPPPRYSLKAYEDAHVGPDLRPLRRAVVGDVGEVLWVLMGGIGLVLGFAGANNYIYVPDGSPTDLGNPRIDGGLSALFGQSRSTGTIPSGTGLNSVQHEFGHLLGLFDSNFGGFRPWFLRPTSDIMNEAWTVSAYDINRIIGGGKAPTCGCQ